MGFRLSHTSRLLVVILFVLVAYWPSLDVPFVFDDFHNIVNNDVVHADGWSDLVKPFTDDPGRSRPFGKFTFALNYFADGLDPRPYHVVNMGVHAANAVLLYLLVMALALAPRSPAPLARNAALLGFAVALIWAVHPVNTQAVTYIVQRLASLAALFYLLSLLLFVAWRLGYLRTSIAWAGIAAAFVLGFMTKEHTVTLPVALVLIDVVFFSGWRRRHTIALVATAVAAVPLLITYGHATLDFLTETHPRRGFSALERLMTQGRVICHYLTLLAWPEHTRLQLDYDFAVSRGLLDPWTTLAGWSALAAVTVAALAAVRRYPWPAFGWLFFLLALSVESSIVMIELAFEHRLYLPSTFLIAGVLAPVFIVADSLSGRRAAGLAVVVLAGLLTVQTIQRNNEWVDQGSLWKTDMERGASPARAALNSAYALVRQGRPEEALVLLDQIPEDLNRIGSAKVAKNRGDILFMLGRYEEALTAFRLALDKVPFDSRSAYSAATTLIQLGRIDQARDMLGQLEEAIPDSNYTVLLRAQLIAAEGGREKALRLLRDFLSDKTAERPAKSLSPVRFHIAHILRQMDRPQAAAVEYRAIVEDNPKNWNAWAHLYHLLKAGGSQREAKRIHRYLDRHGVDPSAWAPGADSRGMPTMGGPA